MGALINKSLIFIKKAFQADIVKVFSLTAISTLVKMLTGLVSVKVVATIIGPSGIALLGQLNNFATIVMTMASGGINSGITKYVAEYKDSDDKVKDLLSTALRITVWCSLAVGLCMILLHRFLSTLIMLSPEYGYVFIIFGFTVFLYALNMMLTSVLNGYKEFKKYVSVNIVGSLLGLLFTLGFILTLGLRGALISAVTFQSVMFFVTLWMIRKLPWVSWDFFKRHIETDILKKYFRYTVMTLVTAATVPVSQMLLRGYVISEISPIEAGWWEGMNRISNMYLMIITSSFSVYYLPRLSEIQDNKELRSEILRSYKVVVPTLLTGFVLVYLLRYWVVKILFTADFLPMTSLFIWQLLGDFFKICSWLLAFLMIAKSMTRVFVVTEVVFAIIFVVLGFTFMQWNGVIGVTQAYALNYIFYMSCMVLIFRKTLFV
ncbi:O-antigen translocase [Bacteroides fragilis]|mgnify:CR=1 FL=1|uniref:O-antigen translocase n=1 Tax=Bacteroides TaxID=816 RepID=UPI00202EF944|nr:O-antigen translocase [Bacteroides fragilis]MCM0220083.1 O-antigen translocase [Bacteroides fragilis]MCM0236859.1 O-antigen translocase [Bacteroides fragilis]MCM0265830.1 O-antigen translocase [Bacteroides fragilis]